MNDTEVSQVWHFAMGNEWYSVESHTFIQKNIC